MPPHTITIRNETDRAKVMGWLQRCAYGFRVEVREPKRTDTQNDRLWAILSDIAKHATINGKRYTPDQWKCVFMEAIGEEAQFLPTLDGNSFFPPGFRSSKLSVAQMSELQTFMEAWAAENHIPLRGAE
jgi:NinB protein